MTSRKVVKFGEIALRLGFVTREDLGEALRVQRERMRQGERHKLIGLILLEMGRIDNAQLIEILRHYGRREK